MSTRGELNESLAFDCGADIATARGLQGTVHFQEGTLTFHSLNFSKNRIASVGSVLVAVEPNRTFTARYLNVVENTGLSVIAYDTWAQSALSNSVGNVLDGTATQQRPGFLHVRFIGLGVVQCVFREMATIFYVEFRRTVDRTDIPRNLNSEGRTI
jgi:hypothetical protein